MSLTPEMIERLPQVDGVLTYIARQWRRSPTI